MQQFVINVSLDVARKLEYIGYLMGRHLHCILLPHDLNNYFESPVRCLDMSLSDFAILYQKLNILGYCNIYYKTWYFKAFSALVDCLSYPYETEDSYKADYGEQGHKYHNYLSYSCYQVCSLYGIWGVETCNSVSKNYLPQVIIPLFSAKVGTSEIRLHSHTVLKKFNFSTAQAPASLVNASRVLNRQHQLAELYLLLPVTSLQLYCCILLTWHFVAPQAAV